MDALDGLKALDAVMDALQHELKELHDERNVPPVERVSLAPLQWAIDKLADDLHTIDTEVKDLRLSVAAARTLDLQRLGDMSRIAKERDELRAQLAELTKKVGELPAEPAPETYQWQVGDELIREDGTIHKITCSIKGLLWFKNQTTGRSAQWWLAQNGYRLHRKGSGDLGVQQLTPRQVEISDSTQADGEGQS
jgi:hypothetical protein